MDAVEPWADDGALEDPAEPEDPEPWVACVAFGEPRA